MDKQKIVQLATQIIMAVENVTAAGENNRMQLSGIYHAAGELIAETGKEDEDDGR